MIVAQLGARMHYAVPKILNKGGLLRHFYTDSYYSKGIFSKLNFLPDSMLPDGIKRLKNRNDTQLPDQKVSSYHKLGIEYYLKRRRIKTVNERIDVSLWAGRKFNSLVIRDMPEADHMYVFNSAGQELLEYITGQGKTGFVEQTIAPKEQEYALLMEEKEKHPDWPESTISFEKVKEFADREKAEWKLASVIICGSEFVKESIRKAGGPVEKCVVIPYGIEQSMFNNSKGNSQTAKKRKLNILTVGRLGLRKGTPAILESARQLEGIADFRLVGPGTVPERVLNRLSDNVQLVGPVPRSEVQQYYAWADVFLLPSVCEGSATSTYEAMANALPTIVTPNTGSIVREGKDGIIIRANTPEAICEAVESLYHQPELREAMGRNAYERAAYGNLQSYENRLLKTIGETLK